MSTMNEKEVVIQAILKNDTFTPDSGVYQNLSKALRAMSFSNLVNLRMIIQFQTAEAKDHGAEVQKLVSK